MQIHRHDILGRAFERRLQAALDSVAPRTPHFANARYRSLRLAGSSRPLRLAPALVGIGAVVLMALSAAAATGSTDPGVWTKRAASTIQSVSHIPDTSPNPPQNPAQEPRGAAPVPQQVPPSHDNPTAGRHSQPTDKPQPTERPEESPRPGESPQPGHSESPNPSPTPWDWHNQNPSPSPSPSPPPHDGSGER
jgi:outer membrane biosynthesis protein TonB